MAGSVGGGYLADAVGRKPALLLTDAGFVLGAAAMGLATAETALLFFVGRFVAGIALGAAGTISSAFMVEISPLVLRGRLVTMNELALCIGCLVSVRLECVPPAHGPLHMRPHGRGCAAWHMCG